MNQEKLEYDAEKGRTARNVIFVLFLAAMAIVSGIILSELFQYADLNEVMPELILLALADVLSFMYFFIARKNGFAYVNKKFFMQENLSIALMIVPVAIAIFIYKPGITWNGNVSVETASITLRPNLITSLISAIFVSSLIVRNRLPVANSKQITLMLFDILFFASLISTFASDSGLTFFIAASVLSWIGIRTVSSIVWIIALIVGLIRILEINSFLGNWGVVYILSAYLSLFLQCKSLLAQGVRFFALKEDFFFASKQIREDLSLGASQVGSGIRAAASMAKSAIDGRKDEAAAPVHQPNAEIQQKDGSQDSDSAKPYGGIDYVHD